MMKYALAKPHITSSDIAAVVKVLKSGILSLGPVHLEFEKQFAKRVGTRYAVSVSSGTAGLHLALLAADIGPGEEVITTPFSFVASANAILYVGAKPVFVDIDRQTYNLDPKLVERAITKKTKAILVVHIFGQCADMSAIEKISKKYRLKIIEDACESLGARRKGRNAGTFGESAVFAFYPNKQMTTGEGGMVVTNSKKHYDLFCSLRNQGRSPNMQWLDHEALGFNYRMDEMSAALGLSQLKKIRFLLSQRKKIAGWYTKYLKGHMDVVRLPAIAKGNVHSWFVYVVQVFPKKLTRDQVIAQLGKIGIASKPYLPSIHLFDFYRRRFGYKKGDLPVSEKVSDRALALPFYIGLIEQDVKYICKQLISILKK